MPLYHDEQQVNVIGLLLCPLKDGGNMRFIKIRINNTYEIRLFLIKRNTVFANFIISWEYQSNYDGA